MQQSLLISGTSHFFLLFLIIFFGWELNKKTESLPPPVQVSILSASKFDAALSTAPKLIVKKLDVKPQIVEELDQKPLLSMESSSSITIDKIKKIELDIDDKKFVLQSEVQSVQISKNAVVIQKEPRKIKLPKITPLMELTGNEQSSLIPSLIAKPKPRTADRIDQIAVSKSRSEKVVEAPKKALKVSDDASEFKEVTDAVSPKEASTKITPEGEKNVPIVVTGAIQSSSPPPSRPKFVKFEKEPPITRPKASELLKRNKQTDQIELLLAQVENSSEKVAPEVSIIEKNNMMSAIAQKLAKYWEQGILAGNSNFEKYIVQVEVEVNSLGEIIGGVKPLVPKVPTGRYLIAFRQASNALISASTLPIIPDKYPAGITFEITFDPEEGFSF